MTKAYHPITMMATEKRGHFSFYPRAACLLQRAGSPKSKPMASPWGTPLFQNPNSTRGERGRTACGEPVEPPACPEPFEGW